MFIEFKNAEDAQLAILSVHNHPFDAKHTFKVNRFTDVDKFAELDEAYVEPTIEEFVPKVCVHSQLRMILLIFCRSIYAPGSPIPKVAISMLLIAGMKF